MKKYLFFASAILALASCTSDSYLGTEEQLAIAKGEQPISFGFDVPAATRAEGAAAATALGNQFIVYGEKSEDADGNKYDKSATDAHQLVFQNYVVKYTASTANTTTSNTENWEYVGMTQTYGDNVTPKADETQTIKYWDYSATNYVFTAFSALESDLSSGKVTVEKVQEKTTDGKVYDKGYTVTLAAAADPTKLYFSDRQVISQGTGSNRYADNQYGGNVTLTFRNGVSQVRVAMYETIPGYTAEIKQFYYVNSADPGFDDMTTSGTTNFFANASNLTTDQAATLTVTYYDNTDVTMENKPKIAVSGTQNNYISLGTNLKAGTVLGTDIANAVYDQSTKAYTSFFPQDNNANDPTSMKLKVDYILRNATTGEFITVYGATAEVPAEYMKWKPNFKYTYIFKISDNTNGRTKLPNGVDPNSPQGLYPITFDAVQVVAEDGQAEYITTVSEPTITTFGVNASGKYVTGGSEYAAGSDIYATFVEGSIVQTPNLSTNVKVYAVTCADATYITEAAVAEAIANPNPGSMVAEIYTFDGTDYIRVTDATTLTSGTTYYKEDANNVGPGGTGYVQTPAVSGTDYTLPSKITVTAITSTNATTYFDAEPEVVAAVPGEDGVDITIDALKLAGVEAGTYAVEYTASTNWTGSYNKVYKVIVVQ